MRLEGTRSAPAARDEREPVKGAAPEAFQEALRAADTATPDGGGVEAQPQDHEAHPEARKLDARLLRLEPGAEPATGESRPAAPRKQRPATEEALLVSSELSRHARPTVHFGTKREPLKAAQKAVGVEQLATRARVEHEPQRLAAPSPHRVAQRPDAPKAPHAREQKKVEEPLARRAEEGLPARPEASLAPAAAAEPFRLEAPPPVQDAAPLAPLAPLIADDASLRVVLLPTVARMSLDAGDAGRLHVQVKVRDGVTELRATGPAAPLLEARQGELRVALAKEGLALGHFDLTQSGSQQRHHPGERAQPEPLAPPTARRAGGAPDPAAEAGRFHVKA